MIRPPSPTPPPGPSPAPVPIVAPGVTHPPAPPPPSGLLAKISSNRGKIAVALGALFVAGLAVTHCAGADRAKKKSKATISQIDTDKMAEEAVRINPPGKCVGEALETIPNVHLTFKIAGIGDNAELSLATPPPSVVIDTCNQSEIPSNFENINPRDFGDEIVAVVRACIGGERFVVTPQPTVVSKGAGTSSGTYALVRDPFENNDNCQ
ncbi:hypothetical protein COV82_02915 [Candidatus Peregrinibacteria bacterium CG11_big_fil_rev_8_21_14_0_20_46_8]|nr:MAG: hypothetical protein COV82_02915 [Candidatus Peregrinibacteria bacterium CG11_big_fil_rev_8_21_14_0_20_46_8]